MTDLSIHQQKHGYRNGHQLLESTLRLERADQDTIDRLSDLSGQIRPGEVIPSYLTIYPLPSRSYHVVARTWPDLKAPRAGCVLTRSLLVPREYWATNPNVAGLIAVVSARFEDDALHPLNSVPESEDFPVSKEARTSEIVEALFLESRKPIVVFEAQDPDLLAARLVTSFWPAFRSEFAICTYALGPRKIGGRDFDLLFAPRTVRSRFSDWPGRKIEAGPPKDSRHRWSIAVADAIFRSARPTLASNDALGLLETDTRADEGAFRKSLLWNELAEKSSSTPSAILGMLDIINSQPGLASRAMTQVAHLLTQAIHAAVPTMPRLEAWKFLQTLAGKVRSREELEDIDREIIKEAAELARSDVTSALQFAQRFQEGPDAFPESVMLGFGDGLGRSKAATIDYGQIPPRMGAFLIANSPAFSESVAERIRAGKTSAGEFLPFIETGDSLWREKAVGRLLPQVDSPQFAPLLPSLLQRGNADEPAGRLLALVRGSRLAFPEFDDAIVDAIRDDATMRTVRAAVAGELEVRDADRFLEKTLRLVPDDIDWLFEGPLEGARSARLLAKAMAKQSDRAVIEAQRDQRIRHRMLDTLSRDVEIAATEIARTLVLGAPSVDDLLDYGQSILGILPAGRLRQSLLNAVLERGLLEAKGSDNRLERLVSDYFNEIGARQLVWWSTAEAVSTPRLAQNLAMLLRLSEEGRRSLAKSVDDLSDRLARRVPKGLDEEGYSAWSSLLWEARTFAPTVQLKAASTSLSATIDLTRSPVSEVVAAAFPTVYRELVSRNEEESDGLLALVMSIPRMLVNDWDHAKPARHGLVDAFMASNWPPSYLLLAAARAGILDRICLRVLRQRGGKKYLDRAVADLTRLDPSEVNMIRRGLDGFSGDDMKDEWD